uniref:Uncharacterized protein LOC114339716 n=1 Tax=Diabrotica virgifera virgifera TaxID=50390 RepID=A0A6P7GAL5_DIAVI
MMAKKKAKVTVAKAKAEAYSNLYDQLVTRESETEIYKIAKQRAKKAKDFNQSRCIRDKNNKILVHEKNVKKKWRKYFDRLLNEEFDREPVESTETVAAMVTKLANVEVAHALQKIKKGKAVGPDNIPGEVWRALGKTGTRWLAGLFNTVMEVRQMPDELRSSILVPVYKSKFALVFTTATFASFLATI